MGAWIETDYKSQIEAHFKSHPVWVRGLKRVVKSLAALHHHVAPRVGAWIETLSRVMVMSKPLVAPRVGAWIETVGLYLYTYSLYVAPRVGAWIETETREGATPPSECRTPCGCVD